MEARPEHPARHHARINQRQPWKKPEAEAPDGEPLLADLQATDDVQIPLRGDPLEVVEKPAATAHHHQQTTPAGEVLGVLLEVVRQVRDPTREEGDLDLSRAGVGGSPPVGTDQLVFAFFRE